MNDFRPLPNRDASPSIRGYVYQVDLTIKRWLRLGQDEHLVLESGEDIDTVFTALSEQPDRLDRIVEQVKHREHSITIRSSEFIGAVANYVATQQKNPQLKIQYRFTTNAKVGMERPTLTANGEPMLAVWQAVGDGIQPDANTLRAIGATLRLARKPSDITEETWNTYLQVIGQADEGDLLQLVSAFSLVTDSGSSESLAGSIQQELRSMGLAYDPVQAEELYHRLFLHVARLLAKRGSKELTRESLTQAITAPTLSQEAMRQLENVTQVLESVAPRVAVLEDQVREIGEIVRMNAGLSADALLTFTSPPVSLEMPPLVCNHSERADSVRTLSDSLAESTWVAVVGGVGLGKTQLAVLVAQALGGCTWLRFRNMNADAAARYLDHAMMQIARTHCTNSFASAYGEACAVMGHEGLLALDDLPQMIAGSPLAERLVYLIQTCSSCAIHVISTSAYHLPSQIHEQLSSSALKELSAPELTDTEAKEILIQYGAPDDTLTDRLVTLINTCARRHPVLVVAAAKFIRDKDWKFDMDTIGSLLAATYAEGARSEAFGRLLATVQGSDSREMLYRLTLCTGAFPNSLAYALAEIPPQVERPRESLLPLDGLWVQREQADLYRVSPLVGDLGKTELPEQRRRLCHRAIGEWVIGRGTLTPPDIADAILQFTGANDFDRAGSLYASVLLDLNSLAADIYDYGLLHYWWDLPLPHQMSLWLRIYIRGLQAAVGAKRGEDVSRVLADLDTLVLQAGPEESLAVLAAYGTNLKPHARGIGGRRSHLLRKALEMMDIGRLPAELQDGFRSALPAPIETLVWLDAWGVHGDDIDSWLDLLQILTPSQRAVACADFTMYDMACMHVTCDIWMSEVDKPVVERDWTGVLVGLAAVGKRAQEMGFELLWAWSVWGEMVVYGEYCNDLPHCHELVESAIQASTGDSHAMFVLLEGIGRQLFLAARHGEALMRLLDAVACPDFEANLYAAETLLRIGQCYAIVEPSDLVKPVEYCRAAVAAAEKRAALIRTVVAGMAEEDARGASSLSKIKSLAELAIAQWFAGDMAGACASWDSAASLILADNDRNDLWKTFFVLFGHVSGYFVSMASTGRPPTQTADGEEYSEPRRGMFVETNPEVHRLYDPEKDCVLPTHLALFSEAVGLDERAWYWANAAIPQCRDTAYEFILAQLGRVLLPDMLHRRQYGESLKLALRGAMAGTARARAHGIFFGAGNDDTSAADGLGRQVEAFAANEWVIPASVHLCRLAVLDRATARDAAVGITETCRSVARDAADPDLWLQVASFLGMAFINEGHAVALLEPTVAADKVPLVLKPLVASVFPGLPVEGYLALHLQALPVLTRYFDENTTIHRNITLPFIEEYWLRKIRDLRFALRNPNEVEAALLRAIELPPSARTKAILRAVVAGVPVKLAPELGEWLYGADGPM